MENAFTLCPDNWVILEIKPPHQVEPTHKVLAGCSGGYLTGDSWRLNSGITKIEETENAYYVHGYSGSVYKLFKDCEMLRFNNMGVFNKLVKSESVNRVDMSDILERYKEDE